MSEIHHYETYIQKIHRDKTCYMCGRSLPKGTEAYQVLDFSQEHFDVTHICVECKTQGEGGEPWTSGQ